MTMRLRFPFCLTLLLRMTVPMRMTVIPAMAMVMSMILPVLRRCRLGGCVPTEVMVVMPMRGSGDDRFRDASLFPQL